MLLILGNVQPLQQDPPMTFQQEQQLILILEQLLTQARNDR